MNRTLFDRRPGAELTQSDLQRSLPGGDITRVRRRLTMLGLAFAIGFTALAVRVVQLSKPDLGQGMAVQAATVDVAPELPAKWRRRTSITDRDGQLLAVDLPTQALSIETRKVRRPARLSRQLAEALGDTTPEEVQARLARAKGVLWLRWRLTPDQVAAVMAVGDPSIDLVPSVTRSYPTGPLTAHVVGFMDSERQGRAGLERGVQESLLDPDMPAVRSSIHLGVQHVVRTELAQAMEKFSAIGGAALVMDIHNGEILSMVSLPDFDANLRSSMRQDAFFNRATYGRYEMGSTFKTFTAALALEGGKRLSDGYDATDPIKVGRFRIRDHHAKKRWMTVAEIFKYSSNIGAAKMAVDIGTAAQRDLLGSIGLLDRPALEIPEVVSPQLPYRWNELETMTIAFGHGLSVSPLQLVAAMGAMVNGGNYVEPTLLKRSPDNPATIRRVIAPRTSDNLRKLLRLVVADGTGRSAAAPGYMVGGKTGTAEKAIAKGYARKRLITSFVATFPMHAPRYVVFAMLDEPKGTKETFNYITAGWNAAPTVGRMIPRIAPLLGVVPVDEMDPEILRAMALPPSADPEARKKKGGRDATL
ncbi:MAG: penicillin-binding protein 2 [Minwuia sp.]|nr:penicillin-binding protein 2 [Minwuia sp.]